MPERPAVFHIGSNKAGSTTLQKALFARHPEVLNLGKPEPVELVGDAVADILDHCDLRKQEHRPLDGDALRASWQKAIAGASGRVPVFSREELIRYYLYGGPDGERLARNIVEMAGPVRVVIVVRHQVRLIESLYLQKANSSSFLDPGEWLNSEPDWFAYGFRFSEIADAWSKVVGRSNVGVFVFEELAKDAPSFGRRLCDFMEIDSAAGIRLLTKQHENVRKSQRTQVYARLRSSFFPRVSFGKLLPAPIRDRWRGYLEDGHRAKVDLPPRWLEQIDSFYKSDNRKLADEFGLPLEVYGYPL